MTLLLRYVLEAEIGRSPSGVVYRARERGGQGRTVAVKRLRHPVRVDVATARHEVDVLGALAHPNIVRLVEVCPEEQGVAVVYAYAAGGSLADELRRAGRLREERIAAVVLPIASALAAAHALGVVHGGVKPANVLFSDRGEPLLADFGTARWRSTGGDPPTGGAAIYVDPARLDHPHPHPTNDVYGLAVICFEALAGVPPLKGATAHELLDRADRGEHADLRSLTAQIRPQVAAVVQRALARHPCDRYESVAAFAGALRDALGEPPERDPVAARPAPVPALPVSSGRALPAPAGHAAGAASPPATAPPVASADDARGTSTRRGRRHTDAVTRRPTVRQRRAPSRIGAAALAAIALASLVAEVAVLDPATVRLAVVLQAPPALLVLGAVSRRWCLQAGPTSRGVGGPRGAARSGPRRAPEDPPPPAPR